MRWVETERAALVDTLRQADPEADTLCDGWNVRYLLAHLVQREQDLLGNVTDHLGSPKPGEEKNLTKLADPARQPAGYGALVERFVAGPPRWSPFRWAGENVNLVEYVIHHEDVRRGGHLPVGPRDLPAGQDDAIWKRIPLLARIAFRRSPVGVVMARPDGTEVVVKKAKSSVRLTGDPVELALYSGGRRTAAQVEVSGPSEAVTQFEEWVVS